MTIKIFNLGQFQITRIETLLSFSILIEGRAVQPDGLTAVFKVRANREKDDPGQEQATLFMGYTDGHTMSEVVQAPITHDALQALGEFCTQAANVFKVAWQGPWPGPITERGEREQ